MHTIENSRVYVTLILHVSLHPLIPPPLFILTNNWSYSPKAYVVIIDIFLIIHMYIYEDVQHLISPYFTTCSFLVSHTGQYRDYPLVNSLEA